MQKELDKVLKKFDTQMADKEKQLSQKTMEFDAMKTDSDATMRELREQNEEYK